MKGTVLKPKTEYGVITGYHIQGVDGNKYYAHLGDLKPNETKLYKNLNTPTEYLNEGDEVDFEEFIPNVQLAIHVSKEQKN